MAPSLPTCEKKYRLKLVYPSPAVFGTCTYAIFPPVTSSTRRRFLSTHSTLRISSSPSQDRVRDSAGRRRNRARSARSRYISASTSPAVQRRLATHQVSTDQNRVWEYFRRLHPENHPKKLSPRTLPYGKEFSLHQRTPRSRSHPPRLCRPSACSTRTSESFAARWENRLPQAPLALQRGIVSRSFPLACRNSFCLGSVARGCAARYRQYRF